MIHTKENNLFYACQQLYNLYNPLQQTKELYYNLINILQKYSIDTSTITIYNTRDIFNTLILKYYHNEITIKSSFINNVLLKNNNHITIFELNSGKSRVDLCKFNGHSIAYEIKTDLDNFNRLKKQLNDYLKIFEKVFVICSVNNVENIKNNIPNECGIYSYRISNTGKYIFKKEKNAITSSNIDPKSQLSLFTKLELNKLFNLKTKNTKMDSINEILNKYTVSKINKVFKQNFKNKYKKNWEFLSSNHEEILEIDYQWFFKNNITPSVIYGNSAN